MKTNKPVLYLLGKKGLRVLEVVLKSDYKELISAVVYATDDAVQKDYAEEIRALCTKEGIQCNKRTEESTKSLKSKYALAVGWRWLIGEDQHDQVIVFHDSVLPKYRGFAPLVAQLINGESEIGVTALIASSEYDKGPILSQKSIGVTYPIKIEAAIDAILPLYEEQALRVLVNVNDDTQLEGWPQDETKASYSVWRDDEDLQIDWSESSSRIERFVNATGYPYNGAFTLLDGKRIVVSEVGSLADMNLEFRHIGKTIRFEDKTPVVICGEGLIVIKEAMWYDTKERIKSWPRFRMRFK